jgi:hypothetical protein
MKAGQKGMSWMTDAMNNPRTEDFDDEAYLATMFDHMDIWAAYDNALVHAGEWVEGK